MAPGGNGGTDGNERSFALPWERFACGKRGVLARDEHRYHDRGLDRRCGVLSCAALAASLALTVAITVVPSAPGPLRCSLIPIAERFESTRRAFGAADHDAGRRDRADHYFDRESDLHL